MAKDHDYDEDFTVHLFIQGLSNIIRTECGHRSSSRLESTVRNKIRTFRETDAFEIY